MIRPQQVFNELVNRITEAGRALTHNVETSDISILELCDRLISGKGEATGLVLAHEILQRYSGFDDQQKYEFFHSLSSTFGIDEQQFEVALLHWQEVGNGAIRDIHFASEPSSQELIRRLNRVTGATSQLVAMRKDLLAGIHKTQENNTSLIELDRDFKHLLASWFNRGFLELRRIEWSTSADVLELIIRYEAVHKITDWEDLRRRVAKPDRRLYAFFHPAMVDDPLIFVEVALLDTVPTAIKPILSESGETIDPHNATTAAFYSISNCQPGLRGIAFGNFLIKQAVMELRRELPGITTFVTLSPVPGFRRWVLQQNQKTDSVLTASHKDFIQQLIECSDDRQTIRSLTESHILKELIAYYLVVTRSTNGHVVDPVARFHLGNGASLEHIHTHADLSDQGMANSWGIMVNYFYQLNNIERNHEAFANQGVVIHSSHVKDMIRNYKI
ncbi:MAG: malonyl-CoA decarboxylase [Arenicella sp.]